MSFAQQATATPGGQAGAGAGAGASGQVPPPPPVQADRTGTVLLSKGGVPPHHRLSELLDAVKQEFESVTNEASAYMRHKSDFDQKCNEQVAEMQQIRQSVYELELSHRKMKERYEEEIQRLKTELDQARIQVSSSHSAPPDQQQQHARPQLQSRQPAASSHSHLQQQQQQQQQSVAPIASQGNPPALGHSSSNVFSGILAGQPLPSLAPPDQKQQQQQPPPILNSASRSGPQQSTVDASNQLPHPQPAPQQQTPQPGYGTPQQSAGYSNGAEYAPANSGSPAVAMRPKSRTTDSPQVAARSPGLGNNLADLEVDRINSEYKKKSDDWFVVYNDQAPRALEVDLVHTLEHTSVVCCVRFSSNGKFVATGCNRSAQIFDVQTGQKICSLQDDSVQREGDLYIRSVCFSPNVKYLATGAEDRQIRVWDIKTRTIRHLFTGHEQDIYSLDFASNGRHIASGSGDRTVRMWDMETGQCVLTLSIEDGVTTVAISPDGRFVAAGSLDHSVRVWEASTGFLVERLDSPNGHTNSVYSVAFAPNGKDLVSGSLDKTIKLWELQSARGVPIKKEEGVCIRTFTGHKDFILSVAFTPDGRWIISGSKDRGVQFWDPDTAQAQLMLQGHKNSVISVAPSPKGKLFATGSGDFKARIWSYTSTEGKR